MKQNCSLTDKINLCSHENDIYTATDLDMVKGAILIQ